MSIRHKSLYKVSPEGRPGAWFDGPTTPREISIDSLMYAGDTVQNSSYHGHPSGYKPPNEATAGRRQELESATGVTV